MTTATGMAMRMKLELAAFRREPLPFTPPPLLPPVDHDLIVEGYAAPANITDREFMQFAANYCFYPLPKPEQIPLLVRHRVHQPAGRILEVHLDNKGLYVKALVTDAEAKRYSHFSVAATIESYRICNAADPKQAFARVTSARLDEISITNTPAQPAARILFRDRPAPALQGLDLAKAGICKLIEMVEVLQKVSWPTTDQQKVPPAPAQTNQQLHPARPPVEPHRASDFGRLISAIEANHAAAP